MEDQVIIVIIGAAVSVVSAVMTFVISIMKERKAAENDKKRLTLESLKGDTEAARAITDIALSLVEPLRAQVGDLGKQLTISRDEACDLSRMLDESIGEVRGLKTDLRRWAHISRELLRGILLLSEQVLSLGYEPCFIVDEKLAEEIVEFAKSVEA